MPPSSAVRLAQRTRPGLRNATKASSSPFAERVTTLRCRAGSGADVALLPPNFAPRPTGGSRSADSIRPELEEAVSWTFSRRGIVDLWVDGRAASAAWFVGAGHRSGMTFRACVSFHQEVWWEFDGPHFDAPEDRPAFTIPGAAIGIVRHAERRSGTGRLPVHSL